VVDGNAGEIKMYEGDSYQPVGSIKLEEVPDSSAYDPATKYMYAVNGGRRAQMTYQRRRYDVRRKNSRHQN
jgi:hypothetical protein